MGDPYYGWLIGAVVIVVTGSAAIVPIALIVALFRSGEQRQRFLKVALIAGLLGGAFLLFLAFGIVERPTAGVGSL